MNNQQLGLLQVPIWWYTEGVVLAWRHFLAKKAFILRSTGLLIFVRNMFQPLYGDTTRQGRVISFFIRIVLLVFLVLWTLLRLLIAFGLFCFHLIALPGAIIMVVYQLFSLF